MMQGAWGKILRVDLTQETTSVVEPEEELYRTYLGGQALGAYYLFKEGVVEPDVAPDDARNLLQFYIGPVTGVSPGGRSTIVTKAPFNFLCSTTCGGHAASELKFAGWDGIQVVGKASDPVYLSIADDQVEIRDASAYWGLNHEHCDTAMKGLVSGKYDTAPAQLTTGEMPPLLGAKHPAAGEGIGKKRLGNLWVIGEAGENYVWNAAVMTEGARAHGRAGSGAIMGDKKLKAIVMRGTMGHPLADKTTFLEVQRGIRQRMMGSFSWRNYGTSTGWRNSMVTSCYPIRNWQEGSWEDPEALVGLTGSFMKNSSYVKRQACRGCVQKCLTTARVTSEDPTMDGTITDMPDWEAMGVIGGNFGFLLPDDHPDWHPRDPWPGDNWDLMKGLNKTQHGTFLHDNYGIDYIDNGSNFAQLMELRQRNLITVADLDGIDLKWGDIHAVEAMMDKMVHREGVGDKIANGAYETAKYFAELKGNPDIMNYTMCAHRYGQPAHTVRGGCKSASSYITNIKPNCHTEGSAEGEALAGQQNVAYANNSAVICLFVRGAWGVEGMEQMMRAATGWSDWTYDNYRLTGDRAYAMGRIFEMYTQMDDPEFSPVAWDQQAPWRWFNEPFTAGPWPKGTSIRYEDGLVVDWDKTYNEKLPAYYTARGCTTTTGIPTDAKLDELGIRDVVGSCATALLNKYGP
jgi:aldehyde:ferredoxin oxidoreductase